MNPLTDWIAFDIETIGDEPGYALQPWRAQYGQAKIRTYAMSWIEDGKLKHRADAAEINPDFRYRLSQMLQHAAKNNKYLVTWKGTFDIAFLVAMGLVEEVFACNWIDGMVLWKNLDRTRDVYNMDAAIAEFLPTRATHKGKVDFEGPLEPLMQYNQDDTDATLLISIKIWKQLTEREQRALMIDFADMPAIAERNVLGIPVDIEGIKKTAVFLNKQRAENYAKLFPHIQQLETIGQLMARGGKIPIGELRKRFKGFDKTDPQRFAKIAHEPVLNLDSDKQLQDLLFVTWGLPIYKMTKGGKTGANKKPAVDKESLIELSHIDERAAWIQRYRETTGLISKCVKSTILSVQYNNPHPEYLYSATVRPEQNKSGTVTDRCTYSSYIDGI